MKTNIIYNKSCLNMEEIDDNSLDTIITSCPYWGLRDYGAGANQIWGGDEDCEHNWGNKIRPPSGEHHHGQGKSTLRDGNVSPNEQWNKGTSGQKSLSQFCQLCSAWHGQLGLEPTLSLYLDHLLLITAECRRVLKPTGVMWWNHGDCYSAKRWSNSPSTTGKSRKCSDIVVEKIHGLPDKCMVLQNYRLILRLIDEQGWILRNTVIWNKPNGMPSSVKDRLANKYEPVFMLVKNKKYWFDLDSIREPHKQASIDRLFRGSSPNNKYSGEVYGGKQPSHTMSKPRKNIPKEIKAGIKEELYHQQSVIPSGGSHKKISNILTNLQRSILTGSGKNPGDYWSIPTQSFKGAHFATFPEKLILKPILSSCPEWICKKCGKARVRISKVNYNGSIDNSYKSKRWGDQKDPTSKVSKKVNAEHNTIGWTDCGCNAGWRPGIILDPFAGSGTTLAMAKRYNRQYIGYEISKDYIPLIQKRLAKEDTLFNTRKDN